MNQLKAVSQPRVSPFASSQGAFRTWLVTLLHWQAAAQTPRILQPVDTPRLQSDHWRCGPLELARKGQVDRNLLFNLMSALPRNAIIADKYSIEIKLETMVCLEDSGWLNTDVITFFLEWWQEQTGCPSGADTPKPDSSRNCWITNTYFYSKLTECGHSYSAVRGATGEAYTYHNVRRWTKKKNVFALDKMIIPINDKNVHWYLAIINFKDKITEVYDSMGCNHQSTHTILLRWLQDEHLDKHGTSLDLNEWTRKQNPEGSVPRQTNCSDCGVFMCLFAAYACIDAPFEFSQRDIDLARRYMVQIIYEVGKAAGL